MKKKGNKFTGYVPESNWGPFHRFVNLILLFGAGLMFLLPAPALTHIYKYIDSNGVVNFTNTPTSSEESVLYLREKGKKPVGTGTVPGTYDTIIRNAEGRYGVESSLIKAVIQAESNFNPRAVSRKGARGLMQIMPANNKAFGLTDSFDPAQNIMGGTRYLKQLLDRYDQKLPLALAAYNAGPEAVDRYKKIPPYPETRAYVQKVMLLYNRYKNS